MERTRVGRAALLALAAGLLATNARAADPVVRPIDRIPAAGTFAAWIDSPRALAEAFADHPRLADATHLDAVRELLESTGVRRARQLVAYYERELNVNWRDMLDGIAGDGVVIASTGEADKTLIVLGARDAGMLARFLKLARAAAEDEYQRADAKYAITESSADGHTIVSLGGQFFYAQADRTLYAAPKENVVRDALKRHAAGRDPQGMAAAKTFAALQGVLPAKPLIAGYADFAPLKKQAEFEKALEMPRNDPLQTAFFGGILDVMRRAHSAGFSLSRSGEAVKLALHMPAGSKGLAKDTVLVLPADRARPHTLPPLEPPGVLFSQTFYWDFGAMWNERASVWNETIRKQFEQAEEQKIPFLSEFSLSKLLNLTGAYHRLVAATVPNRTTYKTAKPKQELADFAFVTTLRTPEAGKQIERLARIGGFAASTQIKVKLRERQIEGIKVIGWTFDEKSTVDFDEQDLRFNYSPCYFVVGDQAVVCSSLDFAPVLIRELKKPVTPTPATANQRTILFADGLAVSLEDAPDALLTRTILQTAADPDEAQRMIDAGLKWVRTLGRFELTTDYRPGDFEFSLSWTPEKK